MNRTILLILFISVNLFFGCSDDTVVQGTVTSSPISTVTDSNHQFTPLNNLSSTFLNSNLPARNGFEMISFKGKHWFMGGMKPFLGANKKYYNDIWNSTDGINWTKVVTNAPWLERADFNLFTFNNKLWIIGGENVKNSTYLNDVWSSIDGINWVKVTDHGPWATRKQMSVNVHNNKLYLIGGHSTTNWHLYQDIWESSNGKDWKQVGTINDTLLGTQQSRQGINEHTIIRLKDTYYLIAGNLASIFTAHIRVLKSKNMIDWEIAIENTLWKDISYIYFGNLRPFVFKGNLIFLLYTGPIKISNTGNIQNDYKPAEHRMYVSKDGTNWNEKLKLNKLPIQNSLTPRYMRKPRSLVINGEMYLYGSYQASVVNKTLDKQVHIQKVTNQ